MNDILERLWNWLRVLHYAVLARWVTAIVVLFLWATPYIRVAAEDAVVQILENKGFTVKDFKDVQAKLKDLDATAGSIQQSVNSINNTLTINAGKAADGEKDRDELKGQVDRLVDYIINKKTDRENYPQ